MPANRWPLVFVIGVTLGTSGIGWTASSDKVDLASPQPTYTEDGELVRPRSTESWVFVGSSIGLKYEGESTQGPSQFHNVFISPAAYREYQKTGVFPQYTMLVLERYAEQTKASDASGLISGSFNGELRGLEVAVKNAQRPDAREGSRSEWAYYAFGPGNALRETARAFNDSACQACHQKHASKDHVWTQFYPRLR